MKFYEVMTQIVQTSHLVGYDLLTISSTAWKAMTPEQQTLVQDAANKAIKWSEQEHLKREQELASFMKEQGLKLHTPDVEAFRKHAQQKYLESDLAKDWPEGMLDKINAL
jgi:TRAP-type C4-dicarboxylate transport system substrate-binding protein